jgi:hypothetical protein
MMIEVILQSVRRNHKMRMALVHLVPAVYSVRDRLCTNAYLLDRDLR